MITSAWDEETATWNNPPLTTSEDEVYLPQSTEPEQDYPDIDVTIPINKIFNEPENYHGLMLRLKNEDPYACMLFASGDCDSIELRPKLEIVYLLCEPPTVDFEYQVDGNAVSFTGISPSATSWHWDFGDGYFSDWSDPWHAFAMTGSYLVCLITWNECGSDTTCELVDITKTSVPESVGASPLIYPNPANDIVFIKSLTEGELTISLSDLRGQQILIQKLDAVTDKTIQLPLNQIEPGLYIMRFDSGNKQSFSKLLIAR